MQSPATGANPVWPSVTSIRLLNPTPRGSSSRLSTGSPAVQNWYRARLTLSAITCPSTSTCIAVGDEDVSYMGSNPIFSVGVVLTITNGTLGAAQESVPPDPWMGSPNELFLYGVACTKVSSCVAVGNTDAYNGVVVPIKNGEPGLEKVIGGSQETLVDGVTCSKNCLRGRYLELRRSRRWCSGADRPFQACQCGFCVEARTVSGRLLCSQHVMHGRRRLSCGGISLVDHPQRLSTDYGGGEPDSNHLSQSDLLRCGWLRLTRGSDRHDPQRSTGGGKTHIGYAEL